MKSSLFRFFPFLGWLPFSGDQLRDDLIAGATVALVLVPQSMAYAQLAGLPVVYGLYASFVPVIVASLWGSLRQLHTGPVAMLSLMSAAALIPFASPGSAHFIELSVMLALMVGVLRLALGLLRLGVVVNFLSSPVIVGFTNAAALIIGLSLLSKIIGVPFPRTESYLADLWNVIRQVGETHWPTLLFAAGTWLVIWSSGRVSKKLPSVLTAVAMATAVSALVGFENKVEVTLDQVHEPALRDRILEYRLDRERIDELTTRLGELNEERRAEKSAADDSDEATAALAKTEGTIRLLSHDLKMLKARRNDLQTQLHALKMTGVGSPGKADFGLYPPDGLPPGAAGDGQKWRFSNVAGETVTFSAGGAVVGEIPRGLPDLAIPTLRPDLMLVLLPAALVMALIGFMEATSISKAIAAITKQRVDTNQELVGQGLANIAGSFFGSYAVSGSFSRSAVAARSGAKTGLFAIVSVGGVVLVLLFLTPYLYHLPQATLSVIVMIAVFGLIRIEPLVHAWRVEPQGAVIGVVTFVGTLMMAPNLANGILLGVLLTVMVYLIRTMRPRAEVVARKSDGTLGGIRAHKLTPVSRRFVPVRFDGSLSFINVAYFEDVILEAQADFPEAEAILVIGSGINVIDASGEEKVRELAQRLKELGVTLMFSGLKQQVLKVFERGGLVELLGASSFFADKERAMQALSVRYGVLSPSEIAGSGPAADSNRPGPGAPTSAAAGS